jgi:hypothetical protein
LPPWGQYLRKVAQRRIDNRIHLADAWCGLCGVRPPDSVPRFEPPEVELSRDLAEFCRFDGLRLALAVGAGEKDRVVPVGVWARFLTRLLSRCPEIGVLLIGSKGERELALSIDEQLSPSLGSRVWNSVGRTDLLQLARVLACSTWVIGADTGPLHLATAMGARALGWYFSRARVHETGPYGNGHWVWQREVVEDGRLAAGVIQDEQVREGAKARKPQTWPVEESVDLILTGACSSVPEGWSLWLSRMDELGVSYQMPGRTRDPHPDRAHVWGQLSGPTDGTRSVLAGARP